jgi:hypothetical protein
MTAVFVTCLGCAAEACETNKPTNWSTFVQGAGVAFGRETKKVACEKPVILIY